MSRPARAGAWLRRAGSALIAAALVLAALAWWVLESSGVAIVETQREDGTQRRTHVWYAVVDDVIWLEAGRPEHPWYLDVQRTPRLRFEADDRAGAFDASTVPGPDAHAHVRALLRAKYGLRDRILGWLIDTSGSIAVILVPVDGEGARDDAPVGSRSGARRDHGDRAPSGDPAEVSRPWPTS